LRLSDFPAQLPWGSEGKICDEVSTSHVQILKRAAWLREIDRKAIEREAERRKAEELKDTPPPKAE